ncbi:transglutaminase family protein [bacterium]|nr:transglutaminase family protein [bacterium]MCP5461932.1 transglutaminase family protein [bacterium]
MIFHIVHRTLYTFSKPVFLEPHTVRLIPRNDPFQKIRDFKISISPVPSGTSNILDMDGTVTHFVWFNGMTDYLTIDVSCIVENNLENPFAFLLYPDSSESLLEYPAHILSQLRRELQTAAPVPVFQPIIDFLLKTSEKDTVSFLMQLTEYCYTHFEYEARLKGAPLPPQMTLAQRKGSCRDIAVLFMEVCRHAGIAARFVSGYYYDESNNRLPELHAWVETYLPGAGWRGFDPSNGIMAANNHIPLCVSPDPLLTVPIHGTYRGSARSTIAIDLSIKKE